ncbi:MAG: hypothetical protein HY921_11580 [Elusimicrobia bacterium]|nr:hypothetical protein [Elusimicrobiota bacterium]
MAPILAHEIFGHSLQGSYVRSHYFLQQAFLQYQGNEIHARLIAWLVAVELNERLADADLWDYMDNPKSYSEELAGSGSYLTKLSIEGMRDPVAAYKARLSNLRIQQKTLLAYQARALELSGAAEHFIKVHALSADRFKALREEINSVLEMCEDIPRLADEAEKKLKRQIRWAEENKWFKRQMASAEEEPQFKAWEEEIQALSRELKEALKRSGKTRETEMPGPVTGQIYANILEEMIQEDKKANPGHWPDKHSESSPGTSPDTNDPWFGGFRRLIGT